MRKLIGIVISLMLSSQASWAITCPELEQLWRGKFLREIRVNWNTSQFNCNGLNALFALTLLDLQGTRYTPDRTGYAPNFYEMVRRNVQRFQLDQNCTGTTLAHTTGGTVSLCPRFFTDSREDRDSTVVHEARHTEQSDPGHATCARGSHKGSRGACDDRFHNGAWQGSGYNADIYYLSWTLNFGINDGLSKDVLQSSINSLLPDRFNQVTAQETYRWHQ
jgi:hypothetical protein